MRRLPGFTPPSAGELVAPAAAPYMKLARRPGRKSLAPAAESRQSRPQSRPNSRRKSAE
jgi:hypothetical protein